MHGQFHDRHYGRMTTRYPLFTMQHVTLNLKMRKNWSLRGERECRHPWLQHTTPCSKYSGHLLFCRASNHDREPQKDATRNKSLKKEAKQNNEQVFDRLIEVFQGKRVEDWKKLIVYSSRWNSLAPGVFSRIEERADGLDDDPDAQLEMRRFLRRLERVSHDLASRGELLEEFRKSPSREWESMVAKYRDDMGPEFFDYIELRLRAAEAVARQKDGGEHEDGLSAEGEALAALGSQLAVLVDAYDRVVADETALQSAEQKFVDLLQSESLEGAEQKLDDLASSGRLDPALLLTMAKAYSGVKETDATKEEVKDIMAHLYFKAKEKFASQAPPEARILKFLISVESEYEREALLEQAFQPGADISTPDEDFVHTTPTTLLNMIDNILGVYEGSSLGATSEMAGQAASLMNPVVIERLKFLQTAIRKKYL